MKIALIQQHASPDKTSNLKRGLAAARAAAASGAEVICFAELAFEPFYPQVPAAQQTCDLPPKAVPHSMLVPGVEQVVPE